MASILESFGGRLGAVGALLGTIFAFLWRFLDALGRVLDLMGVSDLILGEFGEDLDKVLRGFGESFAKALEDFGRIFIFEMGTPAPPRSAPRSVTLRGGPSPRVVDPALPGNFGPKTLQRGVRTSRTLGRRLRNPSWGPSWLHWAPSWLYGCNFWHPFRTTSRSCVFYCFLLGV